MIYLCGPINGCTDNEANDWRSLVKAHYGEARCIDPMRRDYRGREDKCVAEIVELDKLDIDHSSVVLANCWQPSAGTSMEILYAYDQSCPVVSIVKKGARVSPWIRYHSAFVVETLADAYRVIDELLRG